MQSTRQGSSTSNFKVLCMIRSRYEFTTSRSQGERSTTEAEVLVVLEIMTDSGAKSNIKNRESRECLKWTYVRHESSKEATQIFVYIGRITSQVLPGVCLCKTIFIRGENIGCTLMMRNSNGIQIIYMLVSIDDSVVQQVEHVPYNNRN